LLLGLGQSPPDGERHPVVDAGTRFEKGKLVERPDESGDDQKVA
jgi:hypothetical protein